MLNLKLYITGRTPGCRQQIRHLTKLLTDYYGTEYELQVLDIFEHPEEAYEDFVYATPTLIKSLPPPVTQIIGDLNNQERVLAGLKITTTL
jgi:circadian clock protein KaiB